MSTLRELGTATLFTIASILVLGIGYPLVMTGIAEVAFPEQASGSLVHVGDAVVGSDLVGQVWRGAAYFHGRPSAAGNGYDPTQTGGTNLAPTSKKLIAATAAAIKALRTENPASAGLPIPMDLVTSSGSGIDPDVSPEAADFQAPRIAAARGESVAAVRALARRLRHGREWGFLGEPHVNVLELNLALDRERLPSARR